MDYITTLELRKLVENLSIESKTKEYKLKTNNFVCKAFLQFIKS